MVMLVGSEDEPVYVNNNKKKNQQKLCQQHHLHFQSCKWENYEH